MNHLPRPNYDVLFELGPKGEHFYRVGDETLPGVTGFLSVINKPALINWAARQSAEHIADALRTRLGKKVVVTEKWIREVSKEAKEKPTQLKEAAARTGTAIHSTIDDFINERSKIVTGLEPFLVWLEQTDLKIICGDTKVASLLFGYGGALDALAVDQDGLVLLDWKTSSGIWPEYALQVGAYMQAFEETYGLQIEKAYIVRFSKTLPVEFESKKIADLNESFKTFLYAMHLSKGLQKKQYVEN